MWTYPWDVHDLGFDTVLDDLVNRAGLNAISLATSYHAGRFLQPRSPRRKAYFPEDGTIYFEPTPALWDGLTILPKVANVVSEGGDVLLELVRQRDEGGLAVCCWTVCLHNTRLGMLHPGAVTRNAFGDPNYYSLCPSHPDARAYVRTLVEDVTRRYRPDMIELESPCFMGFAHGYHHEKDGLGLTAEDDFLLSLCFCDACGVRARQAGIDFEEARRVARSFIAEACERATPSPRFADFPAAGAEAFRGHPALHGYLLWRFEPVTSLVAEIRQQADPATSVVVIDLKDGWLAGCDLSALGRACDGAILCAYDMEAEAVASLIRGGRRALGPNKFLGAGFRLFFPEMTGREAVAIRVAAAREGGVDGINFYNYGLVPAARLDWAKC
jgi:hypothetical protein